MAGLLAASAPAAPPAAGIRYADGSWAEYALRPLEKPDGFKFGDSKVDGEVVSVAPDQWELRLKNRASIREVWFPWPREPLRLNDDASDDVVYFPYLCGAARKNDKLREWGWMGESYPGTFFAPLVVLADDHDAIIAAATNWPPRAVRPSYCVNRLALKYETPLPANSQQTFGCILAHVTGDAVGGGEPWTLALDQYKAWLTPKMSQAGLYPIRYPDWLVRVHGWINYQLENLKSFDPGELEQTWKKLGNDLNWMQFWGQMSNYAGPANLARPALAPGEQTGCCLDQSALHPRYAAALPKIVEQIATQGRVGFYTRPHLPSARLDSVGPDLRDLLAWLDYNKKLGANAFYVDVLGGRDFGQPLAIARLLGREIPVDTVIEYPMDIYPSAFLISGCLSGGDLKGGPENSPRRQRNSFHAGTFPRFGRYLLDDRIMFLGGANGDHVFWGPKNRYWSERQAFLLGAKFDAMNPFEDEQMQIVDQGMKRIIDLRNQFHWWERGPRYADERELNSIPEGMEARRFVTNQGGSLLVIDNPAGRSGQSLRLRDQVIAIPAEALSIVEAP